MRRKRTPKSRDVFDRSHNDELDLADAPESDLADFGTTATRGFSDAWDDADGASNSASDDDVSQFSSDPEDTKGRDLDKKSKRALVALFAVVLLAGGAFYANQNGLFDSGATNEAVAVEDGPLLAPEDVRIYEAEPTSVALELASVSSQLFVDTNGAGPRPVETPSNASGQVGTESSDPESADAPETDVDEEATVTEPAVSVEIDFGLPDSVGVGPVFWAGRMHLAVFAEGVGPALEAEEYCLVVSLVTSQLAGIDVAANGACAASFSTTGDRLACAGNDLVLLEVWSDDPSVPGEPPAVASVRYRVEAPTRQLVDVPLIGSVRGSVELPAGSDLLSVATELGGAPGDVVTISSGDQALAGTCTLLDRSDVTVKLLPS